MQKDFDALNRQAWQAWGDALKQGPQATGMPGWDEAMRWWGTFVPPAAPAYGAPQAAQPWLELMQQLAGRFAGREASAADIAGEWQRMLGANPMPEMLRILRLQGTQGLDAWFESTAPWLEAWRREAGRWLQLPAFGLAREHQERWQRLVKAQLEVREKEEAFNRLLLRAGERAYAIFEDKLAACTEPGRQLQTARALFDLWVDACEAAYAEVALSPEFREAWAAVVNAQMRLRAGLQKEVEFASGLFGMPTRTEVDAAHRKIAELERAVRALRDALDARGPSGDATRARAGAGARKGQAAGDKSGNGGAKPAAAGKPRPAGGATRKGGTR